MIRRPRNQPRTELVQDTGRVVANPELQLTEGAMGEIEPKEANKPDPVFDDPALNNPRRLEMLRRKAKLTTGVEMEIGLARSSLEILRSTKGRDPDQFAALVALVKPRKATNVPESAAPAALAALRERGLVLQDGSAAPFIAAVLDAAYEETEGKVALVDPIIYPDQGFLDELNKLDLEQDVHLFRLLKEESNRRGRKADDQTPGR